MLKNQEKNKTGCASCVFVCILPSSLAKYLNFEICILNPLTKKNIECHET